MAVGLILVSHSAELAAGVAALAGQMADSVWIRAVGGAEDGGLGTSFDAVNQAVSDLGERSAVLLFDLGGAALTAELVLDLAGPEVASRVRVIDAPLVEGAVAAAVAAAGGADLDAVAAAASGAGRGPDAGSEPPPADAPVRLHREITVRNDLGLHARPVAALIRGVEGWDAQVWIARPGGPDSRLEAVLRVVRMAIRGGETVVFSAAGSDADAALDTVETLIRGGFGELPGPHRNPAVSMGAAPARLGNASARNGRGTARVARLKHGRLHAQPGGSGSAIGPLISVDRAPLHLPNPAPRAGSLAQEKELLVAALRRAERKLAGGNEFEVAHAVLLADPELKQAADARLDAGELPAAAAWWDAVREQADLLAAGTDELVASRAADLREAAGVVLTELGQGVDRIPVRLDGAVVFANDLGPGEVPELLHRGAAGLVLSGSSVTAHAVLVARGLGLPLVVRAGGDLGRVAAGTLVVMDGDNGVVTVDPEPEVVHAVQARIAAQRQAADQRVRAAASPLVLPGGRRIQVSANVGSLADARAAVRFGADGIGLLRTELLLLDRDTYPDEETQRADLAEIFQVLGERPITVRVLDAGGDKPVTALSLDRERNGFLGQRGLRYLLAHPDVLTTQLRAILRASVGHRVSVMAPMVSVTAEAVAFRAAVDAAVAALAAEGVPFRRPDGVGVMIEVPAAAVAADELCAVCDFVSVGTNDLISYLMAADRTLHEVSDLLDPSGTAVQRVLARVFGQARAAGVPVAVCGEIAGMAEFAPSLIDQGVHELSMAPARIPAIKELLRSAVPDGN